MVEVKEEEVDGGDGARDEERQGGWQRSRTRTRWRLVEV